MRWFLLPTFREMSVIFSDGLMSHPASPETCSNTPMNQVISNQSYLSTSNELKNISKPIHCNQPSYNETLSLDCNTQSQHNKSPHKVRKSKSFTCTYCGKTFQRATYLRGPHDSHGHNCPRHPLNYTAHSSVLLPAQQQQQQQRQRDAEHGGCIVDHVDGDEDGGINAGPSNAPTSGAGYVHDDGQGDLDDGILLRTDKILVKEIDAKSWGDEMRNLSYRVYFKEGYIGGDLKHMKNELRELFQSIFHALDFLLPDDQIRIFIDSESSLSVPITIPIKPWSMIDLDDILAEINRRVSSREQVLIGDDFTIDIGLYRPIKGGTNSRPLLGGFKSVETQIQRNKKSYFYIKNDDLSCMTQSILLSYLHSIVLPDDSFTKKYGLEAFTTQKKGTIYDRLEKAVQLGACVQALYNYIRSIGLLRK